MSDQQYQEDPDEPLVAHATDLLRLAGVQCAESPVLERLPGGANNAVFRGDLPGQSYVLKQYFSHLGDPRDRFATETAFVDFLWQGGMRTIPQLLASCDKERLALYRFLRGRRLEPAEVDASHVDQAAQFCRELLRLQELPGTENLAPGSEACFSLNEHLACVDRRLARLASIPPETETHARTIRFVRDELSPCWKQVRRGVEQGRVRMEDPVPRVLSPSDFGFHNAILDDSGRLSFFDFEYAGWDDPAKLVCDFFCQVQVPVPRSLMPRLMEVFADSAGGEGLAERVGCLLPVYMVKWCAIVLNDFLPVDNARRRFSAAKSPSAQQLEGQLEKARRLLEDVHTSF